jgi:AAA15 family ATPase/GTPase
MITKLNLKNFRAFHSNEIDLGRITILTGRIMAVNRVLFMHF